MSYSFCKIQSSTSDCCGRYFIKSIVDIFLAVAGNAIDEVEAVGVIDETIAIVISSAFAVFLKVIDPHCVFQVLMVGVDGAVKHSNYNARISGSQLPCVPYSDIGTSNSTIDKTSVIYEVPLILIVWVIKWERSLLSRIPISLSNYWCFERHCFLPRNRLDVPAVLHRFDLIKTSKACCHGFRPDLSIELDCEPSVKAIFSGNFHILWLNRKGRGYLDAINVIEGRHIS